MRKSPNLVGKSATKRREDEKKTIETRRGWEREAEEKAVVGKEGGIGGKRN